MDGIDGLTAISAEMAVAKDIDELLLLEARARQLYYTMFNEIMRDPSFAFVKRTRQPPRDRLNSLISFGNTYLYNRIATEINKTAMDIRIGFLHSTNKRSQSLNLDIAEIFKPLIVDRAVFTLVNKRKIDAAEHFRESDNGGIYLNEDGRRLLIHELDAKVYQKQAESGQARTYDSRIRNEVRKMLRFVCYDEEYKPYKYY